MKSNGDKMAYFFNAEEIFEMAIRIEENGARFYRKAAGFQSDSQNREMLEKLATMEDHHKFTFEKMRQSLSEADKTATVFDPENESSKYLSAMADNHGGEGSPAAADLLTGKESIAEIIDIAIGLEKESILFYIGLKDMIPPKYGQEKLENIIKEERKHIIQLNTVRKKL
ncbi:rubrerythrin [Thermodesulfobacteriota bacterium]